MVGIIVAMEIEAEKILSFTDEKKEKVISGIKFTSGKINRAEVVIAVSGIGKVFAAICAQTMIMEYSPARIINCGVGGSLTNSFGIGDVIIADGVFQYDVDTSALGDPIGLVSGINIIEFPCLFEDIGEIRMSDGKKIKINRGKIASGDRFIAKAEDKKAINELFDASVCEMEGGAVAQVCYVNKTPCTVVRTVSDTFDGGAGDYEKFKKYAADISAAVITEILC